MIHDSDISGGAHPGRGGAGVINRQVLELGEVFDAEASLLLSLAQALEQQRAGVAGADTGTVDGATSVVVRLLEEVENLRRRRRNLLHSLVGDAAGDIRHLEQKTRRPLPPEVARARESLNAAAREAFSQISVNRVVLRHALDHGDVRIRSILSGLDGGGAGYGGPEARGADPAHRPFLCDEVA